MVRRDGGASYEVSTTVLVSLALVLELLAILSAVGVARVDLTGLVGGPSGPGAHHVGESLEGGAGEVLWRDGPYHGLGRAGKRHQGRLHRRRGGRAGRRDQDGFVKSRSEAGWWWLISLVGRQHGPHSRRDDRPGRARALNLQSDRAA